MHEQRPGTPKAGSKQVDNSVEITSRLPFVPVDGHRITSSRSVQSVDLELIQFTGKEQAMTVAAIRLPVKHALMLAASIQEQVTGLPSPDSETTPEPSYPPKSSNITKPKLRKNPETPGGIHNL
jgi:hypothetical protein